MSKDRRRNKQIRKSKRVILVSYEGKNKTEKKYFDNFAGRDKDFIIKVTPGNETDPVNLVKQTIKKAKELSLDLIGDDKGYCIFDTDIDIKKNAQIKEAIKLARNGNIIPIISSPCVELWFLLHFEYTTASVSNDEVITKLKKYYSNYEKNCDIYSYIENKMDIAIKNSKKLEKYHLQNNKKLQVVETNPYTEIYKIIEEINKVDNNQ